MRSAWDRLAHGVRRTLGWVGTVLVILLITLALDILATRYLLPDAVLQLTELERFSRVYDPRYHHGLLANRIIPRARWGMREYTFATNSLGFKDSTRREVPLESSRHRIVIIGDSFTEGSGFPNAETFAGHVERALRARGQEVFNAGVIGYSPAIYYRRTRHLLEEVDFRFDELVVFLDISDIDDEANQLRLDDDDRVVERGRDAEVLAVEGRVRQVKGFLKQSSMTYRFLSELNRSRKRHVSHRDACLDAVERSPEGVRGIDPGLLHSKLVTPRSAWTYDDAVFALWGERGLAIAAQNMDRLRALLARHGIDLTLVVYPWPAQILARDLESRQVRFWAQWSRDREVRFVNLFPDFIDPGRADGNDPLATYARYFIPCDNHWNAAGHRYVAERLLARRTP